ncbi:MAG: SRPBCC family protein [Kofleriaceae bacterium]
MQIVATVVARPLEVCWRVFTDPATMAAWVPGLRVATLVTARPDGLPEEIHFEYVGALVYSLVYTYDIAEHVIRWEPREAARGGVRGFARFSPVEAGSVELTYAIEHDGGRKAAERALDDPRLLVEAFARRMHEDRD